MEKVTSQTYSRDLPDARKRSRPLPCRSSTARGFVSDPATARRGACLGPLLIDAGQDGAWFTASFKSKRMPGVVIEFNSNSLLAETDDGLLAGRAVKQPLLDKIG